MNPILWINVLHLYQPPTQSTEVVDLVARESYELIVNILEEYPCTKFTLNISGSLLELLDIKHTGLIARYKKLLDRGQIELLGTAAYHPILPLLPPTEVERQILLNETIQKNYLGITHRPQGFYLPELAYSSKIAKLIKRMGYKWILLDDNDMHSSDNLYTIKNTGLGVIFRNKKISNTFPPEYISEHESEISSPVITVHDGEMYGHRHTNDRGYYKKIFTSNTIKTTTISEYLENLQQKQAPKISLSLDSGNWEMTSDEHAQKIYFGLWNHPHNNIHKKLWLLSKKATALAHTHSTDENYKEVQHRLDKSFASCYWWWASGKKLGVFSPPAWNPTEIEKGVIALLQAVRSIVSLNSKDRISFEKKAAQLRFEIWKKHWEQQ